MLLIKQQPEVIAGETEWKLPDAKNETVRPDDIAKVSVSNELRNHILLRKKVTDQLRELKRKIRR